jgi:hypothetical protein
MKPYAKYLFERTMPKGQRFIMREHTGNSIPDFPATYSSPKETYSGSGMKYITIKETRDPFRFSFTQTFLLWDSMSIELKYLSGFPCFYYGDFKEDALLVQSRDTNRCNTPFEKAWLNIWFFEDMKQQSEILYHRWLSGELILKDEINRYLFKRLYPFFSDVTTYSSPQNPVGK